MFYDKFKIRAFKELYKIGTRVRLVEMKGEPCERMYNGLEGIVEYVDDAGHIHVKWDSGSSLSLIPEVDKFEMI